jgi:putative nucleotidyltransferase with HDIG domain
MERIDQIIQHPLFIRSIETTEKFERDRIFCCHGLSHCLDVARSAYITALEEKLPISKELIYAAALLHDIGRWKEYEEQVPHQLAGIELAGQILEDTDFNPDERQAIEKVIAYHRHQKEAGQTLLAELIYRADKQTRPCFMCKAYEACYWPKERKNKTIVN